MGGIGGLGSFCACLSSVPLTFLHCSLLLCSRVGHPQAEVPQGYLLPWLHPQPHHHNVPFHGSSLPPAATLSNMSTQRCHTAPVPPAAGLAHNRPFTRVLELVRTSCDRLGAAPGSAGCDTASHGQLPYTKFHLGQEAGAQLTPPAQRKAGGRGLCVGEAALRAPGLVEGPVQEFGWNGRADGQTWRNDTGFKHVPLLQK